MTKEEFDSIRKNVLDTIESNISKARSKGYSQVEIFAGFGSGSSVSMEKNDIQTLDSYEETVYGIRVIESGCEGFVTTNNSKDLFNAVEEARRLAIIQTTPDDCLELPPAPANPTPPIDELDESLWGLEPGTILDVAKSILEKRESRYPKVSIDSADVSFGYSLKAIGSTKGILRSEAGSSIQSSFMGMAIDGDDIGSFDHDSAYAPTLSEFHKDLDLHYDRFLKSCMSGLGAVTIPSFKGFLFLPPDSIFSFLLGGLIGSLSATSIRMKRSKMEGKIGELVCHPEITIQCNPTNPKLASATSFDREGQNTRDMPVVENGILKNYFYNHYEARKAGLTESNGFASGGSAGLPGCGAKSLDIAPGKSKRTNLENPGGKTIWVNRFSGTSSGSSGDFSGVIKGGFLLDKGEKIPVKEIQIAGNMYELLKTGIAGISEERELLGHSTWAPSILLEGISITGQES